MKLAIVAADYTPGEADQLRRSMAAWKRHGGMDSHRERITRGLLALGYQDAFATQLFEQIKGFGSYGFPESHAASFANIVYVSCWLKCHEPAAFACALLNSQPMGFYAPSQIVQDAQRHRLAVRPVDISHSQWDCTLEADPRDATAQPAIRLGLRMVRGLPQAVAHQLVAARDAQPFEDIADLCQRVTLAAHHREALAEANALRGLAGHRHRARWDIAGVERQLPLFGTTSPTEAPVRLPPPTQGENTCADYARTGLTLGPHPLRQLRPRLHAQRCRDSRQLRATAHASWVRAAGLVITRQRPQTASGVTFVTMEDEHGAINVIVWCHVAEQYRRALLESRLLAVQGQWQTVDGVSHLLAHRLVDLSPMLGTLQAGSRDFH